jgi:hypothetical protein
MKFISLGLVLLFAAGAATAQGVDHAPFDALLRANVRSGVVDYRGFQNNPAFRGYLEALARPGQPDDRAARLVYYINAYNALAIEGILQGLSPSTLFGRARYFKFREWPLNGKSITLHDLEHTILRSLGEPRIHFAIVCASKSCPPLRAEAYAVDRLDAQLDDQARQFVNDPMRNRFDVNSKTAQLSAIFNWSDEDFRSAGSTQRFIARYVADPAVAKGLAADQFKVDWIDYDWNLNGNPPAR